MTSAMCGCGPSNNRMELTASLGAARAYDGGGASRSPFGERRRLQLIRVLDGLKGE